MANKRIKNKSKNNGVRRKVVTINPRIRTNTIPASVNTASRIRATQPRQLNLFSNTDRLIHTVVPAGTVRGTVIYDQVITPSITSRLRTQASLFQKIQYVKLRFEVQTQTATATSGGYVVAFLHDPQMEVGTGETALRNLTAIQGTQTSKMWQSTDINIATTSQQYFTLNGNDIRLFSPGRFIVLSDGVPGNDVAITIQFHWTVKLTRPALQRLVNSLPQAVLTSSTLSIGSDSTDMSVIQSRNWNPNTNVFDTYSNDMSAAFTGLPPLQNLGGNTIYYTLPNPISLPIIGGDTPSLIIGFSVINGILQARSYFMPYSGSIQIATANRTFLWQGARLTPVLPDEFSGNTDVTFLVHALQSLSVNQQPMICKQLSVIKQIDSSTLMERLETKLLQLSTDLQHQ